MNHDIVPGTIVRHPTEHELGIGTGQSVDGSRRITVNTSRIPGKHLISRDVINLEAVRETELDD